MKITATLENSLHHNNVIVRTNNTTQELTIPGKTSGFGSSVNGGEFLCLALATCFCNDLYREAKKRNITITKVSVEASAEFSTEGEAGYNIQYKANVEGDASKEQISELIRHTDKVAEIQNTLRAGVKVTLQA
ncbi:OsmC family protein [Rhodocytophaga rosea]|uniref:OsmC family protein n=1 Tax=Rhodocytophaga rosea TaxID=2704465 RepID=A0A6C0GFJ0_9BACT|nr:OsmC family protein [Rhodocytophaga rosea]QHT66584.1 OsmC family protein [Rhodocytophaga rosea]